MNPDIMARIAEGKIQEAIEEGKFDNLPGKGQPIIFDDDPMTPPHLRLANRILKNAGVLPEWVQVQKDLVSGRAEMAEFRARVVRQNSIRRARLESLPAGHAAVTDFVNWHARQRSAYLFRLKSHNTAVLKLSMMAPSTAPPAIPMKVDAEMAAFDEVFLPMRSAAGRAADIPTSNGLREAARSRYSSGVNPGGFRAWVRASGVLGRNSHDAADSGEAGTDERRRGEKS